MAFTDEEKKIIEWGLKNGKSRSETEGALLRYRTTGSPADPTKVATPTTTTPNPIVSAFKSRVSKASDAQEKSVRGEQSLASGAIQTIGQGAGFVGDVAFEGIKAVTPDPIERIIGEGAKAIAGTQPVQDVATRYTEWKQANPEAAANLEATLNVASILPVGAGAKATGELAVKGVSKVAEKTTEGAIKGGTKLLEMGDKALSSTKSWVQTPIKANVETVMKETPTEQFDAYVNVAKNAVVNNKNPTPLEVVGERAKSALDTVQSQIADLGKQKSDFLGIGGNGLNPVNKKILTNANRQIQSFKNSKSIIESDSRLLANIENKIKELEQSPVVTANQLDKLIDYVQEQVYTSSRNLSIPVTDATTARIRSLIGELNSELKKQLPPEYTRLNDELALRYNIRNELNTKLGKDGELGGSLMKRVFSGSDGNTKKLFAEILDLTGIDLVNEATLARFVMDILGDVRQKSMLEQLNISVTKPTPSGLGNRIVDYVIEKANSPEELIQRARDLTVRGKAGAP